jgi:hypothetical protein
MFVCCVCDCICINIYIYIYIAREREREHLQWFHRLLKTELNKFLKDEF